MADKSAYLVLGLPGTASQADIHEAYRRLTAAYTRERLASDAAAIKTHREIQEAYALLKLPELRAAYDRELGGLRKPQGDNPSRSAAGEPTPLYRQPWLILLTLLLCTGAYAAYQRSAERKAAAARAVFQAAELKRKEAEDALQAQLQLEAQTAALQREQIRKQREDEQRERQERQAAAASAAHAASTMERQQETFRRQQETAKREAQREEQTARQLERQRVQEAEQRVAREKQTLRELCLQRYGRPDC
jgi:curved DNA-binding protein CbpA